MKDESIPCVSCGEPGQTAHDLAGSMVKEAQAIQEKINTLLGVR